MTETVVLRRHAGWWEVRIAREAKSNALDRVTRLALRAALDEAAAQRVRVLVLTGTGASFCAGLDLKERAAEVAAGQPDTAGTEAIALAMALRSHPAVVIAAVNGLAMGGGVTLVNSCTLALAAECAEFACPEIASGGFASMAGPSSQLELTRKRAAWLLLSGERLDAATAERWGLINQVLPAGELMLRAQALAERIAGYDDAARIETKRALNRLPVDDATWQAALEQGQAVAPAIRARRAAAGDSPFPFPPSRTSA